jgi:sialic acid synthase SpsE
MRMGSRVVGPGQAPLRVAFVGETHGGDLQLGYRLVETAGACGAEAVALARGGLSERDFKCVLGQVGHVGLIAIGVVAVDDDLPLLDSMDVAGLRLAWDEASSSLRAAARTGRPLLLSLSRPTLDAVRSLIDAAHRVGSPSLALLAPDPSMMALWQTTWPTLPVGVVGDGLLPGELDGRHAALIETGHRLPVAVIAGRNRL